MVFFRFPFHSGFQQISFGNDATIASSLIYQRVSLYLGCHDFSLVYNGRTLQKEDPLSEDRVPQHANVLVTFSLPGGKGGFGSMLRAIGAQIEKTTNREACRDLSGRRLRDINEEQRLKKWISKEGEREADKCRRRKERLDRLKAKPRHHFNDFEYEKKLSEGKDRVEEALNAGIEKRSKKRSAPEASCSSAGTKKKQLWMEDDISSSSESEGSPPSDPSPPPTAVDEAGCSSSTSEHSHQPHNLGDSSDGELVVVNPPPAESPMAEEEAPKGESTERDTPAILPDPQPKEVVDTSPIDLLLFEGGPSSLCSLGLERLKVALAQRGLKCGGTLEDRARRLWQVRGLQPHQYPTHLLAKGKK